MIEGSRHDTAVHLLGRWRADRVYPVLVHWRSPERHLDCGPSLARRVAVRRGWRRPVDRRSRQALARHWLQRLCARLPSAWSGQGHRTIIIDPDPDNRRAVRAYGRAGFRAIPQLLGRTGDTLIMQYELKDGDPTHDQLLSPRDRLRARPLHRRPEGCQARGGHRAAQPLAAAAAARRPQGGGAAQEHPDDRPDRLRQDRDLAPAGPAGRRAVPEGGGDQVHRGRLRRPRRRFDRARPGRGRHRPGARDQAARGQGAGREERRGARARCAGRAPARRPPRARASASACATTSSTTRRSRSRWPTADRSCRPSTFRAARSA